MNQSFKISYIIALIGLFALLNISANAGMFNIRKKNSDEHSYHTISIHGTERQYLLHMPKNKDNQTPKPLLLVFHGGYQDVEQLPKNTGFNTLSDHKGFIVIYPVGVEKHWNDGRGTSNPTIDDIAFIQALIKELIHTYSIDTKRIYATGGSNGGIFTQRLACEMSDTFAAFAPVISSMPQNLVCHPNHSVSILMINGYEDKLVPYAGGEMKGKGGIIYSVSDTIDFWANQARCHSSFTSLLPDRDPHDHTRVHHTQYTQCEENKRIELMKVEGGGHTWPGGKTNQMKLLLGNTTFDIDGAETIWSFFEKIKK